MTDAIRFFRDAQYNAPSFEATDDAYSAIGSMLTSDIQSIEEWCLLLLSLVEDVKSGQESSQSWEGNSWTADILPGGLHLQDLNSDDWTGDYTLDQAHEVMLAYWNFLIPQPDAKTRAIEKWESDEGRRHPCRPHLGGS